jgi:hypothetical protein
MSPNSTVMAGQNNFERDAAITLVAANLFPAEIGSALSYTRWSPEKMQALIRVDKTTI